MRKRTHFAAWFDVAGQLGGAVELVEIDPGSQVENDEFAMILDMDSSYEAELGELLASSWEDVSGELGAYGSILDFRMAWVNPEAKSNGLWSLIARRIISTEAKSHALLVMKAFPLEYESKVTSEVTGAFEARRKAMVRHYRKLFGVQHFAGHAGTRGWLYKIAPRLEQWVRPPSEAPALD